MKTEDEISLICLSLLLAKTRHMTFRERLTTAPGSVLKRTRFCSLYWFYSSTLKTANAKIPGFGTRTFSLMYHRNNVPCDVGEGLCIILKLTTNFIWSKFVSFTLPLWNCLLALCSHDMWFCQMYIGEFPVVS